MEERKDHQGHHPNGDMGTSENSNEVQNPINSGGKSENEGNDAAVAQTRNATDRAGASLSTKTNVTGSDLDGQVAR